MTDVWDSSFEVGQNLNGKKAPQGTTTSVGCRSHILQWGPNHIGEKIILIQPSWRGWCPNVVGSGLNTTLRMVGDGLIEAVLLHEVPINSCLSQNRHRRMLLLATRIEAAPSGGCELVCKSRVCFFVLRAFWSQHRCSWKKLVSRGIR